MAMNLNEAVIKILQGRAVTQTILAGLITSIFLQCCSLAS